MFLGQFCTLNLVPQSILNDSVRGMKNITNQYHHQAEAKVEAGFQGQFFEKLIQKSIWNFNSMFLG